MPYQAGFLPISICCGAAENDSKQTIDELLKSANKRLYANKKAKNGMVFKL